VIRRVLLATDGSPSSQAAAEWTANLARQLGELEVTLIYVHPAVTVGEVGDEGWLAAVEPDSATLRAAAEPVLAAATERLAGTPATVRSRVEVGLPAEVITGVARSGGYDLIVLGRRGLHPLQEVLVGSVSRRVVRLAHCPVVIVRRRSMDATGAS
jgi:nucleotide-binding universal stress UspA family protein